jgi:hypothetical protein
MKTGHGHNYEPAPDGKGANPIPKQVFVFNAKTLGSSHSWTLSSSQADHRNLNVGYVPFMKRKIHSPAPKIFAMGILG